MAERQQLADALCGCGVDFPPTASLRQLKILLASTLGAAPQNDKAENSNGTSAPLRQRTNQNVVEASATAETPDAYSQSPSEKPSGEPSAARSEMVSAPSEAPSALSEAPSAQGNEYAAINTPSAAKTPSMVEPSAPSVKNVTTARGVESTAVQLSGTTAAERVGSAQITAPDQLAELERKLRILQLKKQINELEGSLATNNFSIKFENALPKFSGDDGADIDTWMNEFKCIAKYYNCDDKSKLLLVRRMLTGSALLVTRMEEFHSGEQLKLALRKEFKRQVSVKDIFRQLESRVWLKPESLMHYILSMQKIAQAAPIEECELVELIVDGLRDHKGSAIIFSSATTLEGLKALIPRYEKLRQNRVGEEAAKDQPAQMRCFNWPRFEHFARDCTAKRRVQGSCFRCGKMDHQYRNCPKKALAAIDQPELEDEIYFKQVPK